MCCNDFLEFCYSANSALKCTLEYIFDGAVVECRNEYALRHGFSTSVLLCIVRGLVVADAYMFRINVSLSQFDGGQHVKRPYRRLPLYP